MLSTVFRGVTSGARAVGRNAAPTTSLRKALPCGTRFFAAAQREELAKYAALSGQKMHVGTATEKESVVPTSSPSDVLERFDAYLTEVLSANWADYLYLVYNVPFWEAEFDELTRLAQAYPADSMVGLKLAEAQEVMDVLFRCEDVRDHINELCELATRASGLMGTGYAAEEKVENMDDHAQLCGKAYEELLKGYPTYKPKIEQTVGHGLAVLRQKHKFNFSSMHRYFF
eukprot:CAMPEP_0117497508 /NCGR_PEP_ID=MMETSP0784-20121206/21220_1 /TAXON_ID=39447 /ORGANISM="" /LENGTH=228 /DNA_ID=CAMNT_0005292535 /DNA_START=56 /DNA_END=742 /DNA_ORIENTATION=+